MASTCESALQVSAHHQQRIGVPRGGPIATMAQRTAGSAGGAVLAPGESALTAHFKFSLLRARRCTAAVPPGRASQAGVPPGLRGGEGTCRRDTGRAGGRRRDLTAAAIGRSQPLHGFLHDAMIVLRRRRPARWATALASCTCIPDPGCPTKTENPP